MYATDWGYAMESAGGGNGGQAVRPLLAAGADVNARDREGRTPLLYAASHVQMLEAIQPLLDAGADVNARDRAGVTPLLWYLRFDRKDEANALIARGAKVGLVEALLLGRESTARELLAAGADQNARGPYRQTALMIAAEKAYPDVVEALLRDGARVNDREDFGMTALLFAVAGCQPGRKWDMWRGYAQPRDVPEDVRLRIVRLLMDAGADVHARNLRREDALTGAAAKGYGSIVSLLLERGMSARTRAAAEAMVWSAADKDTDVLRAFLDADADVDATTGDGLSALMRAAQAGKVEAVKLLLAHGADPNLRRDTDDTALDLALANHHGDIAALLRAAGAKP